MAALRSRCGHYIFLPCGLFFFFFLLFSSPNLSRRTLDVYILPHMAWQCKSETFCTRLAEKYRTQNRQKNYYHLRIIAQLCRAIYSQLRHILTIGKKLVKQQYPDVLTFNVVNFGPLTAEIGPVVCCSIPSKLQRVSCLGSVTAATSLSGSQPNFAWCLAVSWAGTLHIHFRGFNKWCLVLSSCWPQQRWAENRGLCPFGEGG